MEKYADFTKHDRQSWRDELLNVVDRWWNVVFCSLVIMTSNLEVRLPYVLRAESLQMAQNFIVRIAFGGEAENARMSDRLISAGFGPISMPQAVQAASC